MLAGCAGTVPRASFGRMSQGRLTEADVIRRAVELIESGCSLLETARAVGIGKTTAFRVKHGRHSRQLHPPATAPPPRCPICRQKITIWPCVECVALGRIK